MKVLYVAANAKKVPALTSIKYYYKSRFYVSNAVKAKIKTVKFLTKKGKSKVTTIKANAFKGHSYLKTIKNLNKTKVTSIGNYAFAACNNITTMSLPASCKSVGERAFAGCAKLTKIYMPSKTKVAVGYNFIAQSGIDKGAAGSAIYVPAALYNAYYTDTGTEWPYYKQYLVKKG